MSLLRCVSWHRALISPWAGVEHLVRSDSHWQQRVFVSCCGMCRGGFTAYLHDAGYGRRGREEEGCDGSEKSLGRLGLCCSAGGRVLRLLRRGLRSRKDWTDARRVRSSTGSAVRLYHPATPCHSGIPRSVKGREWLSTNWGLRGAIAPSTSPPHYPLQDGEDPCVPARYATRKRPICPAPGPGRWALLCLCSFGWEIRAHLGGFLHLGDTHVPATGIRR